MNTMQREDACQVLVTTTGEKVSRTEDSIVVRLPKGRAVLSTAWVNGGYRTDLGAVFNHQPSHHATCSHELEGGSVEAYLGITAGRLGLDPASSAGLITAARMRHAAFVTESFRGVEVTAIVTAGVEVNGGRAGDPASYFQESGKIERVGGTINTILIIGADLPERTMVRAVITAAEAKTVALQQLMAQSRYSSGIATGSGTDGIAIIADTTSPRHLTDAGKHSKLGELIGNAVIRATTLALERQSGLTSLSQRDIMVRLGRYGVTEEDLWKRASAMDLENRRSAFIAALREVCQHPGLVGATAAVLHLHDEAGWGLIPEPAAQNASLHLLSSFASLADLPDTPVPGSLLRAEESVLWNLSQMIAWICKQRSLL